MDLSKRPFPDFKDAHMICSLKRVRSCFISSTMNAGRCSLHSSFLQSGAEYDNCSAWFWMLGNWKVFFFFLVFFLCFFLNFILFFLQVEAID